jgi:hypothetical protein
MSNVNIEEVRGAVLRSGLHICLGVPVGLLVATLILSKGFGYLSHPLLSGRDAQLVSYVFIVVSVVDAVAAYMIKRRLINAKALMLRFAFQASEFPRQLTAAYSPVFAICAMPAVYGMVCYFLCADLDTYVLISVICLAAYLFLKPKEEEIEGLVAEIFKQTENGDIHL